MRHNIFTAAALITALMSNAAAVQPAPEVTPGKWTFRSTFTDDERRMINHHTRVSPNPVRPGEFFVDSILESQTAAHSDEFIKTEKPYRSALRRMYLNCGEQTLKVREITVHEDARLAGKAMATHTFDDLKQPVIKADQEPYTEMTREACIQ